MSMEALMRPRLYYGGQPVDLDNPPVRYQRQRILAMFDGWRGRVSYLYQARDSDEIGPSLRRVLASILPGWEREFRGRLEELEERHLYMDMTNPMRGRLTSHGIGGWTLRGLDDPGELRKVWEVIDRADMTLLLKESAVMDELRRRRQAEASSEAEPNPRAPSSSGSPPTSPDEG
jgi:hypothetical protein